MQRICHFFMTCVTVETCCWKHFDYSSLCLCRHLSALISELQSVYYKSSCCHKSQRLWLPPYCCFLFKNSVFELKRPLFTQVFGSLTVLIPVHTYMPEMSQLRDTGHACAGAHRKYLVVDCRFFTDCWNNSSSPTHVNNCVDISFINSWAALHVLISQMQPDELMKLSLFYKYNWSDLCSRHHYGSFQSLGNTR